MALDFYRVLDVTVPENTGLSVFPALKIEDKTHGNVIWRHRFEVNLSCQNGSIAPDINGTHWYEEVFTVTVTPDDDTMLFDEWSDGNTDNPRAITVLSSIGLTAYCSVHHHGVYFYANYSGHERDCYKKYVVRSKNITMPNKSEVGFDRADYRILSWNTMADGSGQSYKVGEELTVWKVTRLYAQWAANIDVWYEKSGTYTITLEPGTYELTVIGAGGGGAVEHNN